MTTRTELCIVCQVEVVKDSDDISDATCVSCGSIAPFLESLDADSEQLGIIYTESDKEKRAEHTDPADYGLTEQELDTPHIDHADIQEKIDKTKAEHENKQKLQDKNQDNKQQAARTTNGGGLS